MRVWTYYMIGVLSLTWIRPTAPSLFTSMASLQTLVRNSDTLRTQLERQLDTEVDTLAGIERFIGQTLVQPGDDVTAFIDHPINAHNFIKQWVNIGQVLNDYNPTLLEELEQIFAESDLGSVPDEDDYLGSVDGLARLQKTYGLPTRDLAAGIIRNHAARHSLDRKDYLHMAKAFLKRDYSDLADSWMELYLEGEVNQTESAKSQLRTELYRQVDHAKEAFELALAASRSNPDDADLAKQAYDLLTEWQEQNPNSHVPQWENDEEAELMVAYESLCAGNNLRNTIFVNKDLICVHRRGILPYVQYKEEIHSFDPRISLIYDVISDRQADLLKEKAFPSLSLAQIGDPSEPEAFSDERVGKLSWLPDDDPAILSLSLRVADITGLSTQQREQFSDAEDFQIVNYGLGGQYQPHFDFYEDEEMLEHIAYSLQRTGDRIATFMYYLSEVKAEGATVFPDIGVRIPPIKNAAALWYNYRLSGGAGDERTLHAGCPVLLGQKWVGNKWIRQAGQFLKRPCGLTEDQIDPIWYR